MTDHALPPRLARMHAWARAQPFLWRFTLANRILLAMAFFPTGLVKLTGQRFTSLPVENPVGFFFEAMYQTGPYWRFIGGVQVAAAILLLIPSTATIGALLFLPVGTSIFLITWGVGFGNTVYVAAGMLLAVTYLVCWDGDRVWAAASHLWGRRAGGRSLLAGAHWLERAGWVLGASVGLALFLVVRGFLPRSWTDDFFFVGLGAVAMVVVGWVVGSWGRRASRSTG